MIGGENVRLVLWNEHWTTEFTPDVFALEEMIAALKMAASFVRKGYALAGTATGVESPS